MLSLTLEATGQATRLRVRQTFTAVTAEGRRAVAAMDEAVEREVWDHLTVLASDYLRKATPRAATS